MKLRIQGNALRLRLDRDEVRRMGEEGLVAAHISFGAGAQQRLEYALEASEAARGLDVRYEPGRVAVLLPRLWVLEWVETERVGFEAELCVEHGGSIHVVVEKDFACLHRDKEEENPFAYPHPAAPIPEE